MVFYLTFHTFCKHQQCNVVKLFVKTTQIMNELFDMNRTKLSTRAVYKV